MHVDITEKLKPYLTKRSAATKVVKDDKKQNKSKWSPAVAISVPSNKISPAVSPPLPSSQSRTEKTIELGVELENNDECNISHISITAVIKKSTNEVGEFKS